MKQLGRKLLGLAAQLNDSAGRGETLLAQAGDNDGIGHTSDLPKPEARRLPR